VGLHKERQTRRKGEAEGLKCKKKKKGSGKERKQVFIPKKTREPKLKGWKKAEERAHLRGVGAVQGGGEW